MRTLGIALAALGVMLLYWVWVDEGIKPAAAPPQSGPPESTGSKSGAPLV